MVAFKDEEEVEEEVGGVEVLEVDKGFFNDLIGEPAPLTEPERCESLWHQGGDGLARRGFKKVKGEVIYERK